MVINEFKGNAKHIIIKFNQAMKLLWDLPILMFSRIVFVKVIQP
jgi:hypothetical protein